MSTGKFKSKNQTAIYLVALVVIIIAFVLLGGGPWARGLVHGNMHFNVSHLNWIQILISLCVGFLLGLLYAKRR